MHARNRFALALLLALALAAPVEAVYSRFAGAVSATQITNSGTLAQTGIATFAAVIRPVGVAVSSGGYVTITSGTITMDGDARGIIMSTSPVLSGAADKGRIYYSTSNVFMVVENNGVPKPIVDPPGNWTCTVRTGAGCTAGAPNCTDTVACVGVEKALSGGCSFATSGAAQSSPLVDGGPTGQGWTCNGYTGGGTLTVTARVNCCL